MKKDEFIALVKTQGEYKTKLEAEKAVRAFTDAVTDALVRQEDVALIGFGTFNAVLQKGKTGKVPGTDKTYTTQDKMVPKFKAGVNFKQAVENSK